MSAELIRLHKFLQDLERAGAWFLADFVRTMILEREARENEQKAA